MSLILDALKKSEQERRRERGPDLQSIHRPMMATTAPKRRHGWWLFGGALALLNAAGVAWWLLRSDAVVDTANRTAAAAQTVDERPTPAPVVETGPVATATSATTVTANATSANSITNTSSRAADVVAVAPVQNDTDAEFSTITPGASEALSPTAPVQELWELPEAIRRNLPPMTYSFHVYSSDPLRRTIIINNRRLREGEQVADDLLLEEITQDGVILATAGYRVHIAVLGEW